jgi:hypothetical protein
MCMRGTGKMEMKSKQKTSPILEKRNLDAEKSSWEFSRGKILKRIFEIRGRN